MHRNRQVGGSSPPFGSNFFQWIGKFGWDFSFSPVSTFGVMSTKMFRERHSPDGCPTVSAAYH
jgi:hypothetical protein